MKPNPFAAMIDAALGAASPVRRIRSHGWIGLQPRALGPHIGPALSPRQRMEVDIQRHRALDAAHSLPPRTEQERKAAGLPHQGEREMARRRRQMGREQHNIATSINNGWM